MFIEERHQAILHKLDAEKRISANDLANEYGVSIDTIRRDLSILEEKGLLKRTHGGAIPLIQVRHHTRYPIEEIAPFPHFDAIARKAAEYISQDDTIFMDGSKISLVMTKYLPKNMHFTVVTNSVVIANEIRDRTDLDIYVAGGKVCSSGLIADGIAREFVKTLRFDLAFITGAGLTAEFGLSCTNPELAAFFRELAIVSRKIINISAHDKVGYESFCKVIDAMDIDVVIVDQEVVDEEVAKLRELGVEVVIV